MDSPKELGGRTGEWELSLWRRRWGQGERTRLCMQKERKQKVSVSCRYPKMWHFEEEGQDCEKTKCLRKKLSQLSKADEAAGGAKIGVESE